MAGKDEFVLGLYSWDYLICEECGAEFKGRNYVNNAGGHMCDMCAHAAGVTE